MLIDKITPEEMKIITIMRNNISEDRTDFISGEYADNDYFLRLWEEQKQDIYNAFGGKLILKKRINSVIEDDELYEKMRDLFWTKEVEILRNKLYNTLEPINEKDWNYANFEVPNENFKINMRIAFRDFIFSSEAWVSNKYNGPTMEIKLPNGQVFKMIYGCKVMKALGRIVKSFNDTELSNDFEVIRLRQSQIMNEANISANLCLSIHPLDYMTASYNANDWRSCMNWEDGEYRRGVIEMMNSRMVVVAYIEANSTRLRLSQDLEWNSKRWREFFIVTPELISGIKGYPYWNRILEDETLKWLSEIFNHGDYRNEISVYNFPNSWDGTRAYKDDNVDVHLEFDCGPAMYNDFYGGNEYHMIFRNNLSGKINIFYSGESECVYCGKATHNFDSEESLLCDDCVSYYHCSKCGDSIYHEEDLIEFNGRYYCHYCYENLGSCDCCGCVVDTDIEEDGIEFVVGRNKETTTDILYHHPHTSLEIRHPLVLKVCADCAKTIFKDPEKVFNAQFKYYSDWSYYYQIIPIEEFTAEGLDLFDPEDLQYFWGNTKDKSLSA